MRLLGASLLRRLPRKNPGRVESGSSRDRILAFLRSDCSGGALLEAALIMPVYLILLTGMVSTVMALGAYQKLGFATFTAAQTIGAGRSLFTDPCATVVASVTNSLPGYAAGNLTYTLSLTQTVAGVTTTKTFGPITGSGFTCSGSNTTAGTGGYALYNGKDNPVTVVVGYQYTWLPIYSNKITTGTMLVENTTIID
jgi:Flp pilus assembly protein TadG